MPTYSKDDITLRANKTVPLTRAELDINFEVVKQNFDDLVTQSALITNNTAEIVNVNTTLTAEVNSIKTRLNILEGKGVDPLAMSISSADTVAGGSTGTADDVVIVTTNGIGNVSTLRFQVIYSTAAGTTSSPVDNIVTIDLNGEYKYDLNIPIFRDFAGSKINKATINVYDDPNLPNARTDIIATKEIAIVDPTGSISVSTTPLQIDEGTSNIVTVDTTNLEGGTNINYSITSANADVLADITTPATGQLTVPTNSGTSSVTLTLDTVADTATEGDETLTVTFTHAIDSSITVSKDVIINDSSRATETWTIQSWLEEVFGTNGLGVVGYDVASHVTAIETARQCIINEPLPSGATFTGADIWTALLTQVFTDPGHQVIINTTDTAYLTTLNTCIANYASSHPGEAYDYLVKRPSAGTNLDDIGYKWMIANTSTPITSNIQIYSDVQENPNDL